MNKNLPQAVLPQEITVRLPLSALINLGESYKPGEALPKIGSHGRVGIYAGIARADDQGPDHTIGIRHKAVYSACGQRMTARMCLK